MERDSNLQSRSGFHTFLGGPAGLKAEESHSTNQFSSPFPTRSQSPTTCSTPAAQIIVIMSNGEYNSQGVIYHLLFRHALTAHGYKDIA